ncbi:hypothetical protein QTQ03_29395 [Micromonospora sp. WMMA1363]|uniref:plasmid mobilization protein n=1 Tax=Micromonospora sp. WMMA1363 TaxID=3053985 RepID=UPI00259D0ABF|nr:hypothetical protein [Micromonospora sp. WMMA1363]MDM4723495.1 hypothetical protein [Micromonospora sp. WMMA1363]
MTQLPETTHVGAVHSRRRQRNSGEARREIRVNARFNAAEYERVAANAAAARMAVQAWCAKAAAAPGMAARIAAQEDERAAMLTELLGMHRQLAGAARNLNQVTAKLHALDERPDNLEAILRYVERVANRVDDLVIRIAAERRG